MKWLLTLVVLSTGLLPVMAQEDAPPPRRAQREAREGERNPGIERELDRERERLRDQQNPPQRYEREERRERSRDLADDDFRPRNPLPGPRAGDRPFAGPGQGFRGAPGFGPGPEGRPFAGLSGRPEFCPECKRPFGPPPMMGQGARRFGPGFRGQEGNAPLNRPGIDRPFRGDRRGPGPMARGREGSWGPGGRGFGPGAFERGPGWQGGRAMPRLDRDLPPRGDRWEDRRRGMEDEDMPAPAERPQNRRFRAPADQD